MVDPRSQLKEIVFYLSNNQLPIDVNTGSNLTNLYLMGTENGRLNDDDVESLCQSLLNNTVFQGKIFLENNSITDQVFFLQ